MYTDMSTGRVHLSLRTDTDWESQPRAEYRPRRGGRMVWQVWAGRYGEREMYKLCLHDSVGDRTVATVLFHKNETDALISLLQAVQS